MIAFKPNISFLSTEIPGLQLLETLLTWIPADIPIIIDAKRGDIGNTAKMQANFYLIILQMLLLYPYMGSDSVTL